MGIVGVTSDGQLPLMGTMDDVFSYSWGKDINAFEKNKIQYLKKPFDIFPKTEAEKEVC